MHYDDDENLRVPVTTKEVKDNFSGMAA